MKKSTIRDLAIIAVLLLVLGFLGVIDVRVHVSPNGWSFCIAPVEMWKEVPRAGTQPQQAGNDP